MKISRIINDWMLPSAMILGCVFYQFFIDFTSLLPVLIFIMLFLTFNNLSPSELRFTSLHFKLLLVQIIGGICCYLMLFSFNTTVAQGALMCVFIPTATASAVITGMLRGNVSFITTYVFISNLAVAIAAPIIFSFIGVHHELSFIDSFLKICEKTGPLLIAPLLAAWLIRYTLPNVQYFFYKIQKVSFYTWGLALIIVTAKTVFFLKHQNIANENVIIVIALNGLLLCLIQFFIGKMLGRRENNETAAGQSMGQKNTILAIWMSQIYFNPLASIGPASYVLWQNMFNSWQLWHNKKNIKDLDE